MNRPASRTGLASEYIEASDSWHGTSQILHDDTINIQHEAGGGNRRDCFRITSAAEKGHSLGQSWYGYLRDTICVVQTVRQRLRRASLTSSSDLCTVRDAVRRGLLIIPHHHLPVRVESPALKSEVKFSLTELFPPQDHPLKTNLFKMPGVRDLSCVSRSIVEG